MQALLYIFWTCLCFTVLKRGALIFFGGIVTAHWELLLCRSKSKLESRIWQLLEPGLWQLWQLWKLWLQQSRLWRIWELRLLWLQQLLWWTWWLQQYVIPFSEAPVFKPENRWPSVFFHTQLFRATLSRATSTCFSHFVVTLTIHINLVKFVFQWRLKQINFLFFLFVLYLYCRSADWLW